MLGNQQKCAVSLLLAGALMAGCFSACGRSGPEQAASSAPALEPTPFVRPALVEPAPTACPTARPQAQLVNGSFEQGFDGQGRLPGWTVDFSEWGEGEAAAVYNLSAEQDNPENTSQKLSLYNGMEEPVEFCVSQTVEGLAAGEYIVSLIFEGGPVDAQTGTQLWVNGLPAELGRYSGWRNWKQVISQRFAVEEGGTAVIEIKGRMNSKDWMDLDDVELVPAAGFRARSFARYQDGQAGPDAMFAYEQLTNGEFEAPEDEYGRLIGWTVEFANWGSGEKRAGYRLTTEEANYNTTQKLSLGNSTGEDNSFTVSQQFWVYESGEYVLAFDWEADEDGLTDPSLHLNGRYTLLGHGEGWKNWKQAVSAPVYFEKGTIAHVEIGGPMKDGGWMDIDNVIFVPAAAFEPKRFPHFGASQGAPQAKPIVFTPLDHIQNGSFTQGIVWDDPRYPDGYLPGWTLPAPIDWGKWRFNTASGNAFEVNNISQEAGPSSFAISQQVRLKPGTYHLRANSPWTWVDTDTVSGVTITAAAASAARARAAGSLPVSLTIKPGEGPKGDNEGDTDAFTLAEETLVNVTVTFSLAGGRTAAVKDIEFVKDRQPAPTPTPAPGPEKTEVAWKSAKQAGGDSGKADSTTVDIVFSQQIPGLTADNFTVTGAAKGSLTGDGKGTYWLGISGLTAENGGNITVSVAAPEGYTITPASQSVQVWKKTEAEPFTDPIKNKTFSTSTEALGWSLPEDWTLSLSGQEITTGKALEEWIASNGGTDSAGIRLGTVSEGESWIGIRGYAPSLQGFSLTQAVYLEPGNYQLDYTLTAGYLDGEKGYAWGLVFSIPEVNASIDAGNCTVNGTTGTGSLPFSVSEAGEYTLTIKIPETWPVYIELHSVSLEKLS